MCTVPSFLSTFLLWGKKKIQDQRTSLLHISAQKGVGLEEVRQHDVMHIYPSGGPG